jgi:hypothetical protein
VAGAGDGNVTEAGVEQVWVNGCVGVDEDALGGEALGAVAGDGVAVVEVAMFGGIETGLASRFEAGRNSAFRSDGFDNRKVAIGNAERFVRCGELDAVAN